MIIERNLKNHDTKTSLLVSLIVEHHPMFIESEYMRNAIINDSAIFNIPRLIEESMAACSNDSYAFIDAEHADFTDGSECKTGSLHVSAQGSAAEISSVRSAGGILKQGGVRAVISNPVLNKLHYIFIPKKSLHDIMHKKDGTPKVSKSAWLRYNSNKNEFTTIKKYGIIELSSFKELCIMENH